MNEEEPFLDRALAAISEAEVVTVFLPLLRRALVVDARHDDYTRHTVEVAPQLPSIEARIEEIERVRPSLGKVRSIVAVPWLHSVRQLREDGVADCLSKRLVEGGVPQAVADHDIDAAITQLDKLERLVLARMIMGAGYTTLWSART